MSPDAMSTASYNPTSQTLSIPKLLDDGSNWVDYDIKARTAMGSKGLIRHIQGTARKPVPYTEINKVLMVDATTPATEDQIDAKERRLEEYDQKEYLARHILLTSISPRLLASIKTLETSALMWNAIKADATSKTELHQIDTLKRLHQKKCSENDSVKTHLEELVDLRDKLAGMGAPVGDKDFRTIILASLPLSYRNLISAITVTASLSSTTIDNNHLIRILTEEADHRLILDPGGAGAGSALVVNERPAKGNRQIGSAGKKRTKCFNCEKLGHIKSECWAPGGGKEGQGPKQKSGKTKASANAASSIKSNRDSPQEEFAFVTTMVAVKNDDFDGNILVDSGASSHFCPDKSKFVSFVECKTTVNTADGRSFVATGRGNIETTIPNGASETVVTLKDTIYTP